MPHKRSQEGKRNQQERKALAEQRRVAYWLINGTKHNDSVKKETVARLTSDDVLTYIAICHSNPSPLAVPTDLDGTVLHNSHGEGLFDFRVGL
jgi:hypothetical protein